jgi:hypothetical protein
MACLDVDLPRRGRARLRAVPGRRATHHGQRRFTTGQPRCIRASDGWLGVADLVDRDRHLLRALFTLAQYLQDGLHDSPLESGLTLVPWVAAFGLAGQLVCRLPPRLLPRAPAAGCLGIQFSALLAHVTNAVPAEFAPDISGVSTTTLQIGGAVGVAAFGTLYLSLTRHTGATPADASVRSDDGCLCRRRGARHCHRARGDRIDPCSLTACLLLSAPAASRRAGP